MDAIIMAGGEGSRLKAVTGETPKPMALLAGKPVLEHILLLLKSQGITRVCMSLRYRPETIRSYFGNGEAWGMEINYNVEQTPLGTAGGVKACMHFCRGEDFLVISGDCACDFELYRLIRTHTARKNAVTMALYPCAVPLGYGTVLTDKRGRIISFTEKPGWNRVVSDLVNTGIYVINKSAMALVPDGTAFDFSKQLFPLLMQYGYDLGAVIMKGYWCDIGTPRQYHACNLDALDGRLHLSSPAPESPKPHSAPPPEPGVWREVSCLDRAYLMRVISQTLMEAGADFSDGVRLTQKNENIHIFPCEASSSIRINVSGGTPEQDEKTALAYEKLAKCLLRQPDL